MLICVECKREMTCDKNGVWIDFGCGHVYPSDRFKCPSCGRLILNSGNCNANHDPDHRFQDEYLDMTTGNKD
jgi:predicted RNA-binding Zn-ribbon protein involved in translation (DUF1610 family)